MCIYMCVIIMIGKKLDCIKNNFSTSWLKVMIIKAACSRAIKCVQMKIVSTFFAFFTFACFIGSYLFFGGIFTMFENALCDC